jgi:hypothetical protein
MTKAKKQRAKKYDEKLKIEGSFEDVIKASVASTLNKSKEESKKSIKKK